VPYHEAHPPPDTQQVYVLPAPPELADISSSEWINQLRSAGMFEAGEGQALAVEQSGTARTIQWGRWRKIG
jgi:hypothetical protein